MKLSFRLIVNRYEEEEQFRGLLAFLSDYRECVDEIALFTEYWHHGYYPLDAFAHACETMKDRMERLRAAGFRNVGINMLVTLGHLPEAWDWLPKLPYEAATAPDGTRSGSSFCPNSPEFRAYIARKYALAAQAGPDFIWVDDDIRMHSLGVPFACFCPLCVSLFNGTNGTAFTREQLTAALNASDGGVYRERWVAQNARTLERLLALVGEAVHAVDPGIELGLMTLGMGLTTYAGADFHNWFPALRAVKARPGHGFYDDSQPFAFIRKIHEVGRQIAHYPASVQDIQYELENVPFQKLGKSVHITLLECTAAIMAGARGIAFDALKEEAGALDDYHELMQAVQASKRLWTEMDERAGTYRIAGLYPALSAAFEARRTVDDGNWFALPAGDNGLPAYALSEIGIPLTADARGACGTILSGNMPEGFTTEELKAMLSRGVLLDGRALEALTERGLGAYCGAAVDKVYTNGVYEQLTADPLNNGYAGEIRDARSAIWKGLCYSLRPLGGEVRVLSRLISFTKQDLGPAATLYENELGGRVAVLGYFPWQHIHSSAKRAQTMRIGDWIGEGRLPVFIDRCLKVVPFVKYAEDGGGWLALLLNASFDDTGPFDVKLRYPATAGRLFELLPDGSSVPLPGATFAAGQAEITLAVDGIAGWKFRIFYRQQ